MQIRDYRPQDLLELANLFYETVHQVNSRDYTPAQLDAWADGTPPLEAWNQSFLAHHTLVVEKNGRLLGFGDMDSSGYLDRLYIHKDYQGKGIASWICQRLEWACPAALFTVHASITAKPFFERRGYQVAAAQCVQRNGVSLTNYKMSRKKPSSPPENLEVPLRQMGILPKGLASIWLEYTKGQFCLMVKTIYGETQAVWPTDPWFQQIADCFWKGSEPPVSPWPLYQRPAPQ